MSNAKTFQDWAKGILPIVQAAANGAPIEVMKSNGWVAKAEHLGFNRYSTYRIKPKTIRMGEYDVPEPMREMPARDTDYYIACITTSGLYGVATWVCDAQDIEWFNRGVVHSTKDAAVLHAKALLSLTEVSN